MSIMNYEEHPRRLQTAGDAGRKTFIDIVRHAAGRPPLWLKCMVPFTVIAALSLWLLPRTWQVPVMLTFALVVVPWQIRRDDSKTGRSQLAASSSPPTGTNQRPPEA
jgi:hypothetical protein